MEILEAISLGAGLLETTLSVTGAIYNCSPRRQCSIHITNLSSRYILENPRTYASRGSCVDPLPPRILPSSSGGAVFAKTPRTGRGFSGTSIYDLFDNSTEKTSGQMVVMFKVPYNFNLKANEYAVGVLDISEKFEKCFLGNLTKNMESVTKGQATRLSLIHKSQNVAIRATMSDCDSPVIKVHTVFGRNIMEANDAIGLGLEIVKETVEFGDAMREMSSARRCRIDITNDSKRYILHNPRTYSVGGTFVDPLSPRIRPGLCGAALVSKTAYTGRGFSGVFTYDLLDGATGETSQRLAVWFKVPYDLTKKQKEYAVGLFDVCTECDNNLYKGIATNSDSTVVRGQARGPSLTFTSKNVTVRATMSESSYVVKVNLSDD